MWVAATAGVLPALLAVQQLDVLDIEGIAPLYEELLRQTQEMLAHQTGSSSSSSGGNSSSSSGNSSSSSGGGAGSSEKAAGLQRAKAHLGSNSSSGSITGACCVII